MMYREIIAVCSQIHIKHINTRCGQNVELFNVKLLLHIATIGLQRVNTERKQRIKKKCAVQYKKIFQSDRDRKLKAPNIPYMSLFLTRPCELILIQLLGYSKHL